MKFLLFIIFLLCGCSDTTTKTPAPHPKALSIQELSSKEHITSEEMYQLIQENRKKPDFILLDIRTPAEFSQGFIDGAINLDFYAPDFSAKVGKLDKNKHYILYCRTGNRTSQALSLFKKLGFTKVQNHLGGIVQWQRTGYPVISK